MALLSLVERAWQKSSPASAQAPSQTKGVVSLAHSAIWLPMAAESKQLGHVVAFKKKKKTLGIEPKAGVGPFSWWQSCGEYRQLLISLPILSLKSMQGD